MSSYPAHIRSRVNWTIKCRDCDSVPKHKQAGKVLEDRVQVMHNGIKIAKGSYHGDWMTEIIEKLNGHHEPQEEKAFHEVLGRLSGKRTMVELGSNWAYYSMWFNSSHLESKNIMIEPNKEKLEAGKINFKLNNMTGEFLNAFVSSKSNSKAVFRDWDGKETVISEISIDDLLEKNKISKLDILHSDIQGAEFDMLIGCEKSVNEGKIEYFFISTHSDSLHDGCTDWFLSRGFNILCSHTLSESYSADGSIVASRNDNRVIEISKRR